MKHIKRIFALLLVVVMACALCATAFADGSVTYEGNSRKFVFAPGSSHSPTNLFENFQSVMPGDTITEQIVIKNTSRNGSYIRIYMRALGAHEGSEEFLSQMKLTVKHNGSTDLFEAPANETAQLTEWVCLGTMHSGGTATLDVTLEVPITMGNEFQHQLGYLDWEFKAEEIPRDPNAPPQTGDTSDIFIYSGILILCLVILIVLAVVAAKRKKKEDRK